MGDGTVHETEPCVAMDIVRRLAHEYFQGVKTKETVLK